MTHSVIYIMFNFDHLNNRYLYIKLLCQSIQNQMDEQTLLPLRFVVPKTDAYCCQWIRLCLLFFEFFEELRGLEGGGGPYDFETGEGQG